MIYEVIKELGRISIKAETEDGLIFWIPIDESNSDYQQYLIDTDGGLPLPEEQA